LGNRLLQSVDDLLGDPMVVVQTDTESDEDSEPNGTYFVRTPPLPHLDLCAPLFPDQKGLVRVVDAKRNRRQNLQASAERLDPAIVEDSRESIPLVWP
jgi:hypothetical protein